VSLMILEASLYWGNVHRSL